MLLTTRVKLVLAETPTTPLAGVRVELYDRDQGDPDDRLGEGVTDAKGEVLFSYDSSLYTDTEDKPDWRIDSLPDLYVVVYDKAGQVVLSTRSEALENQLPKLITVPVGRELAEKHRLLGRPPTASA